MLTDVLIYDRAGLGKSASSSRPRTSREMIKELGELVIRTKIKLPFILVGHSFGGVNARMYATEYTNDVCGLILVDSTPEDIERDFFQLCPMSFSKHILNNLFMKVIMMNLWKV